MKGGKIGKKTSLQVCAVRNADSEEKLSHVSGDTLQATGFSAAKYHIDLFCFPKRILNILIISAD